MTKTLATAAIALVMVSGSAQANNCAVYVSQLGSIATSLNYENSNMTKYTAMMESALSIKDLQSAKIYATMGKNTIIRVTGLSADTKRIFAEIRKTPGKCGVAESEIAETESSMSVLDKVNADSLKAYSSIQQ